MTNTRVTAHKCGRLQWRTSTGERSYPQARGQGQQPRVTGCDGTGTTERSYPTSEVRAVAGRSYPTSEVRGGSQEELPSVRGQRQWTEELPPAQGQGRQLGGATPHRRPGIAAGRSYPRSKKWWLDRHRRAERSYSTFKVRRG